MLRKLTLSACWLILTPLACGGSGASTPPPSPPPVPTAEPAPAPAAPVASARAIDFRGRGPLGAMAGALSRVPLDDAKYEKVSSIFKAASERHATMQTSAQKARATLLRKLAGQVEKGKVDAADLRKSVDEARAPMEKSLIADRDALKEIHGVLSPEERSKVVEELGAQRKGRRDGHRGLGRGRRARFRHVPFEPWAKSLELTPAQKTKIQKLLADAKKEHRREHPARGRAPGALKAFATDAFDPSAKEVSPQSPPMLRGALYFAQIAAPVLTPKQRKSAAAALLERADRIERGEIESPHPRGPEGPGGPGPHPGPGGPGKGPAGKPAHGPGHRPGGGHGGGRGWHDEAPAGGHGSGTGGGRGGGRGGHKKDGAAKGDAATPGKPGKADKPGRSPDRAGRPGAGKPPGGHGSGTGGGRHKKD